MLLYNITITDYISEVGLSSTPSKQATFSWRPGTKISTLYTHPLLGWLVCNCEPGFPQLLLFHRQHCGRQVRHSLLATYPTPLTSSSSKRNPVLFTAAMCLAKKWQASGFLAALCGQATSCWPMRCKQKCTRWGFWESYSFSYLKKKEKNEQLAYASCPLFFSLFPA